MALIEMLLLLVALAPWPALLVVAIEALAATMARSTSPPEAARENGDRPSLAIIVPAHDEAAVLAQTLDSLRPQMLPADRLLVVADNCTDATADIARAHGIEVLERTDPERRGKSYALAHALQHLSENPPAVVGFCDADSLLADGSVDRLVRLGQQSGRPVQACYLLTSPETDDAASALACFTFLFRNKVRQLGLATLGLPCQINGCGMFLPWPTVEAVDWDSGRLAEDLAIGLDLASAGRDPLFCPQAHVTSPLPTTGSARTTQRRRWIHGHFDLLLQAAWPALLKGLVRGRTGLVALAIDMMVPPLTLLIAMLAGAGVLGFVGTVAGLSTLPLRIVLAGCVLLMLVVGASWHAFGRKVLPTRALAGVPDYLLGQAAVMLRYIFGRQQSWERTGRDSAGPDDERTTGDDDDR